MPMVQIGVSTGALIVAGLLLIAATPIGNLGDLTERFRKSVAEADFVACEDTRRSGQLVSRLGVHLPLIRLDEHAPLRNIEQCLERLQQGETGVYMSDAGTPGVSDPGPKLVREAVAGGIPVRALPGAAAVSVALSLSGFEGRQFVFAGFLPRREAAIEPYARKWCQLGCLAIFFPSPHRIQKEIGALAAIFPDMSAVLLREMTKLHETHYRGTLRELAALDLPAKGEYSLVVEGTDVAPKQALSSEDVLCEQIARFRGLGLDGRQLVSVVCEVTGAPRKEVYRLVHSIDAL